MTPEFDATTRVTISPSVYARAFGKELVLLDFGRGEYFGLDETGAEIWRGLVAGEPLESIAAHVASSFDVTPDEALRDIIDLVVQMHREGLLRPVER